ncbi:MAG: carboxypeptidase-like regulatory domain-containing protein [Pseudomonadota bacterium]
MTMPSFRPATVSVALAAALLSASGCAQSGPRAQPATGAIEGHILHPAHAIPAMRICAIAAGAPAQADRVCVSTRSSQGRYRIAGLPPGDYTVIAVAENAHYPVGGHMQQVQCIRAPCPEMPKTVTVAPGARVVDIDLNGFYERREDFPALPAE